MLRPVLKTSLNLACLFSFEIGPHTHFAFLFWDLPQSQNWNWLVFLFLHFDTGLKIHFVVCLYSFLSSLHRHSSHFLRFSLQVICVPGMSSETAGMWQRIQAQRHMINSAPGL